MKLQDKNTRYYINIDVTSKEVPNLDYENQFEIKQQLEAAFHRVFITEGQYNKLLEKWN